MYKEVSMDRKFNSMELSDEVLLQLRESLFKDLKQDLDKRMSDIIKGSVADFVGSILEFPLTVKQVAKLTGRSEDNIYKMCQRGVIPYTKVGGQIHINLREIKSALILVKDLDRALTT